MCTFTAENTHTSKHTHQNTHRFLPIPRVKSLHIDIMSIYKCYMLLICLLQSVGITYSQTVRTENIERKGYIEQTENTENTEQAENIERTDTTERTRICINFRLNSAMIDTAYADNARNLRSIVRVLRSTLSDSTTRITRVSLRASASPEGSYRLNRKLANKRLDALESLIRREVLLPDSIIERSDSYIDWEVLKARVNASDLPHKENVMAILNENAQIVDYFNGRIDNRVLKLQTVANGWIWQKINELYFEQMRKACVVFEITHHPVLLPSNEESDTVSTVWVPSSELSADTAVFVPVSPSVPSCWTRRLHLKTNALGWGLAIANAAVEVDLSKHFSLTLPVYYSTWNYFKSTLKFRTFLIQPELRYWLSAANDGLFAGAHFGLAYYNIAYGDYRYQDHRRHTPGMGGGLSLGYRMPISRDSRWRVEFSLGAGVYPLHYDKFINTPHTKDGLLLESVKKTFWGLDHVAVSFSYSFDFKKKGGK